MKVKKTVKYGLVVLAGILGSILLFFLAQALLVYQFYGFFLDKAYSVFGLDMALARIVAISAAVIALFAIPWAISFVFLPRKRKHLFLAIILLAAVCFAGLYYGTANIFFDRATGQPVKYYIKTLEGFKFSSTGDFDSKFGARYKPITPEVIKEYHLWQKTRELGVVPEVKADEYFDRISGEAIVWYSERPNGEIKLFSLPGHDPMTNQLLKPITKEMVEVIVKKRAQEELERKRAEEEKKAAKEKRAAEEREKKKEEERAAIEAARAREEAASLRIRKIWGVAQSYSKDKVAGLCGSSYPAISLTLTSDPFIWGHEIKWKGAHYFEVGQLCLEIRNLKMPDSEAINNLRPFGFSREEYQDFGLGYFVQLDNAVFSDYTMAKYLFVFRTFLGDSPPSHIRKCFKVIPIKKTKEKPYDVSGEWEGSDIDSLFISRIVQSGNKFTGVSISSEFGKKTKNRWGIEGWIIDKKVTFVYTDKKTGFGLSFVVPVPSKAGGELSGFWSSGLKYKGSWQVSWQMRRKGSFSGSPEDILQPE